MDCKAADNVHYVHVHTTVRVNAIVPFLVVLHTAVNVLTVALQPHVTKPFTLLDRSTSTCSHGVSSCQPSLFEAVHQQSELPLVGSHFEVCREEGSPECALVLAH